MKNDPILQRLFETIESKRGGDPSTSYTAKLFQRGEAKIAQKVGEEAIEAVVAAVLRDKPGVIAESADLLYHWAELGIVPEEVWAELRRREGISGLVEKDQRKK
jgi:phosphoribosyl-ATP pyrophosphohydrolase